MKTSSVLFGFLALLSTVYGAKKNKKATTPKKVEYAVSLKGDIMNYTDGNTQVSLRGTACSKRAVGEGTYPGFTIEFTCLQTGYDNGYAYAIACGARGGNQDNMACQAFRNGPTVSHPEDGLVTNLINCGAIVNSQCSGLTPAECPYSCRLDMCDQFNGLAYFIDTNKFTPGTTGRLTIGQKKLIVGKASEIKWRQVRTNKDMCFFAEMISKCYLIKSTTNLPSFKKCVTPKLRKYVTNNWLAEIDRVSMLRLVSQSQLFPKKVPPSKTMMKMMTTTPTTAGMRRRRRRERQR